jgi:hypothetical protein
MVDTRETVLGIFYYLSGLSVTLASPELQVLQRFIVFSFFAIGVLVIESGRRILAGRKENTISREPQVEVLLDGLLDEYRKRSDCHLRANVMVPFENRPIQSKFVGQRSYKTLEFKDHTGGYSEEELELAYEPGQGSCGLSWKQCKPVVYGEGQKETAEKAMTNTQLQKTRGVESVLSVPVYKNARRPENLVCVVNVDSENSLPETCFTEDNIVSYTEHHADVIAATVEDDYYA